MKKYHQIYYFTYEVYNQQSNLWLHIEKLFFNNLYCPVNLSIDLEQRLMINTSITILISYKFIIYSIAIILIDKCTTLFHFITLCIWRHEMR